MVRLCDGIPRYVRGGPRGYVDRHRVHLEPFIYRVSMSGGPGVNADVLALLAHELAHVVQYRELGPWRFRWRYLREYVTGRLRRLGHDGAYRNISFERAARDIEARVRRDFASRTVNA